ncbi:YqhR family membrane protein [Alkalibacillus aidingensis]|uniref:YqhR family membrane protein n=1 Tax=Alkalibacillus aidingensis TaxID=2747607 RepID=UPI00166121CE|nr:YqhR family membrane protein [Alkalibacillus aidingensis]
MEQKLTLILKSLVTGFIGAIIFGALGTIAYYLNFSEVSHATFIIRSIFDGEWTTGILAELISLMVLGFIGVIPALIYYLVLKRSNGVTPGLLYGMVLWAIPFILLNPLFEYVPSLYSMDSDTIVTTVCQFILYGVFVGYTISYEYHGERIEQKISQNS